MSRIVKVIRMVSKALLLLCLGLLASCQNSTNNPRGTVFRYNESKGITSLDPAFARSMGNIWAVNQLYNGLVQLNDSLQPQPCLAKSWGLSDDGLSYTFHLRTDVRFHNHAVFAGSKGRTLTAHDVQFSFERILDPNTLSPGRWVFAHVAKNGFVAPNDSTFIIHLTQPFPPFLGILSMPYCYVVPKEAIAHYGKDFGRNPIGTGPFKFEAWYEGVKLVLHKNPSYFEVDSEGHQLPYLDAVGITFITDPQSIFLEFMKGNLDMLSGLEDGSYKDALLTPNGTLRPEMTERMQLTTMPFLNTEYLGFLLDDTAKCMVGSPLLDVRVRQAINLGFDRAAMMRHLRSNIGAPGVHGFVPPASLGGATTPGYNFDPKRAAQLLAEAGYPKGKGLPEIVLHTTSQYADLCEYLQNQLGKLGIILRVEVHPNPTLAALVSNGQVPFFRKSWMADHADAENFLSLFLSDNSTPNGPNYTRFNSAEFDGLYSRAMKCTDPEERNLLYHQMDSVVTAQAPYVVLYYDQVLRFVKPETEGLKANPMNMLWLKTVRKPK